MADWSQLPPELLTLIAKHLKTRFDVVRFRSVCSSWRSSISPKLYPLPKHLPSKTIGRCEYFPRHISRNTLFLVRLHGAENHNNRTAPACWLVNIRDGTHRAKMQLLNPLSDSELKPLPVEFPKELDLTNFQVIDLGHQFVGLFDVDIYHPLEPLSRDYRQKVAFLQSSTNSDDFMMLTLFQYFVQNLAFFRSGEKEWTLLENVRRAQDIISFNGKFYAIEREGRTIVVDQSLNVSFLQHVGSRSSRMFLVQSDDSLLAVEMLFCTSSDSDVESCVYGCRSKYEMVGFRIFRLDEEEQKWDEMESLGHRILFLGLRQAVSASASDLYWGRGNLIFYSTGLSILPFYNDSKDLLVSVFDLDTGTDSPLENCPAYCNLFWPPPEWVTSPESNSSYSVTSAIRESEYQYPDSYLANSIREVGDKSPERETSARQKIPAPQLITFPESIISNSTGSVTTATPEIEYEKPDSYLAISTKEVQGVSPKRVTSAGEEAASPSSRCRFKFCCF